MKLIVGDDAEDAPIVWSLGTLSIPQLPGTTAGPRGVFAAAQPKPEIRHVFRPPAKQPPAIVSLAFTVLTLLPLPAAIFLAFAVGGNFKVRAGVRSHPDAIPLPWPFFSRPPFPVFRDLCTFAIFGTIRLTQNFQNFG